MALYYPKELKFTKGSDTFFFRPQSIVANGKIFHAYCHTQGNRSAKAVTAYGFDSTITGDVIFVTFIYGNTADPADLTLTVNNTWTSPIKGLNAGTVIDLPDSYLAAGQTYMFSFDGTNWVTVVGKDTDISGKVDKNQTVANAGKILGIGNDGYVTPVNGDFAARLITVEHTVTNVSGAYTATITDDRIAPSMEPIRVWMEDPSVFRGDLQFTPGNGTLTISCAEVVGESDIEVKFIKATDESQVVTSEEFDILNNRLLDVENVVTEIPISIAVNDWVTVAGEYVGYMYTWTSDLLTENCKVNILLMDGSEDAGIEYFDYEKALVSGQSGDSYVIRFFTQVEPTGALPLTIQLINCKNTSMTADVIETDAISGAANVQEALETIGSAIEYKGTLIKSAYATATGSITGYDCTGYRYVYMIARGNEANYFGYLIPVGIKHRQYTDITGTSTIYTRAMWNFNTTTGTLTVESLSNGTWGGMYFDLYGIE